MVVIPFVDMSTVLYGPVIFAAELKQVTAPLAYARRKHADIIDVEPAINAVAHVKRGLQ
jgi:hypothetical protein